MVVGLVCHSQSVSPVPTFLAQSVIICNSDFLSDLLTPPDQPPPGLNTTQIFTFTVEFV